MKKTFVKFRYEGEYNVYFYEEEVAARDPEKIVIPEGCSGFQFLDREVATFNGNEARGLPVNESGWFYIGQKKYAGGLPGYVYVVVTPQGRTVPLRSIDQVLEPK